MICDDVESVDVDAGWIEFMERALLWSSVTCYISPLLQSCCMLLVWQNPCHFVVFREEITNWLMLLPQELIVTAATSVLLCITASYYRWTRRRAVMAWLRRLWDSRESTNFVAYFHQHLSALRQRVLSAGSYMTTCGTMQMTNGWKTFCVNTSTAVLCVCNF